MVTESTRSSGDAADSTVRAADMIESKTLDGPRVERYAGWSKGVGASILAGEVTLEGLEGKVASGEIDPRPRSGRQELLENEVNQRIWATRKA